MFSRGLVLEMMRILEGKRRWSAICGLALIIIIGVLAWKNPRKFSYESKELNVRHNSINFVSEFVTKLERNLIGTRGTEVEDIHYRMCTKPFIRFRKHF